ncbi:MAG TPA: alpha/beta hydrolase [Beijerinckiaceae bacterium]|nr:alpha/beta hydrolase [Beijerinckiaceae bacterium]
MTIVLVHGAWSGAWSWKGVAKILRARGFEVYAPTLSGLADRGHIPPQIVSLDTHVADICGLLRYEDLHDVMLVGHSYGGMVITGVADRESERISGMIYLDAFVPESGQSLWDIAGAPAREAQMRVAQAHDGGHSLPRPNPSPAMDQDFVDRWGAFFTPQPVGTLSQPFVSTRSASTWPPRHYFLCTRYKGSVFHRMADKVRGAPGWTYGELDALHDVLRTEPELTARSIAEVAGG